MLTIHGTPEAQGSLVKALNAAIQGADNPALDAENPRFRSRYATLGSVLKAQRKAFSGHNLSLSAYTSGFDASRKALTIHISILHDSGAYATFSSDIPMERHDPQAMGSAQTYGLRYAICALLGIVGEEDDDGNRATPETSNPGKQHPPKPKPAQADEPPPASEPSPPPPGEGPEALRVWCEENPGLANSVAVRKFWTEILQNAETLDELKGAWQAVAHSYGNKPPVELVKVKDGIKEMLG